MGFSNANDGGFILPFAFPGLCGRGDRHRSNAVELALILAIDYTPWGNAVFGTARILLAAWLFRLPFALAMLLLEEARKWVRPESVRTIQRSTPGARCTPGKSSLCASPRA